MKGKIIIGLFLVIAIIGVMFLGYLYLSQVDLQAEIDPIPLNIQQGENSQLAISLRNISGLGQ